MGADDLLCLRPQKALARLNGMSRHAVGGRGGKSSAVQHQSASILEKRASKLGGMGQGSDQAHDRKVLALDKSASRCTRGWGVRMSRAVNGSIGRSSVF